MEIEPNDGLSITERVEKLLEESKESRNDDIFLVFLYWKNYQKLDIDPEIAASKLRNSETIRRCRQKIQSEGRFLPTKTDIKSKRGR